MMLIADLTPGDMMTFRIQPDPEMGQINAGRWGLFKVLHTNDRDTASVALYGDIFDGVPRLGLFSRPKVLIQSRFPHLVMTKGGVQSTVTLLSSRSVDLPDARIIKTKVKFNADEKAARAKANRDGHTGTIMAWDTLSMQIDHEDRAKRDTVAWNADIERLTIARQAELDAQRDREAKRLKGITLDQLATETPFPNWGGRSKIVPPAYREAARAQLLALIANLKTLGPKPKRKDVRAALKACVQWFNDVDGTMGYAIETVEREDIYQALEEICWACKQNPLVHEIENWRDW